MTTKTITIKATDVALDLVHKRDTGAPHGWISSILSAVLKRVPQAEQDSLMVHGLESVTFTHTHRLTEAEVLAEQVQTLQQRARSIDQMLPRVGEGLTAEQVNRIRVLLEGV